MKRFVISEDERARILSMHESATKRQYLSEQGVTQPAGNVNKGVEVNNDYVRTDATGKLLGKNPKFVDLANKNNINLRALTMSPYGRNEAVRFKGTDGKEHYFYFLKYNGEDYSNARQKEQEAFKKVHAYWMNFKNSNDSNLRKCVDPSAVKLSDVARTDQYCKRANAYEGWKKVENETGYKNLQYLASIQDFVEFAPKWKTA
jgi:hypothetical protein